MTTDDLRAAYPEAADAVELLEFGDSYLRPTPWDSVRRMGLTPAQFVADFKESADMGLAGRARYGAADSPEGKRLRAIRAQMDHPHLAAYVAAKLGSM